jgi:shikimate dehydrogenase
VSRRSRSHIAGLIGSGIGPSLTPPMHEREGDKLGLRYVYLRFDLDQLPGHRWRHRCSGDGDGGTRG